MQYPGGEGRDPAQPPQSPFASDHASESEQRVRALMDASFEGIAVSIAGKVIDCNQRFAEMFGYTYEECLQIVPSAVTVEEDLPRVVANIKSGSTDPYVVRGRRKDGSVFWCELLGRNIVYLGQTARVTGFRDITGRIEREREIERWEHIFHHAYIGFALWLGPSDRFEKVNAAMAHLHGYTAEELTGAPLSLLMARPEEAAERIAASSAVPRHVYRAEHRRKDGSTFPVRVTATTVYDAEGRILYRASLIKDITDEVEREQERLRSEAQREHAQKLESLGALAGGIAHDFNNLLAAILGNVGLAIRNLPESSPARPALERAEAAANRAADLTGQLLGYAGRGRLMVAPVDVSALVRDMAQLLEVTLSRRARLELSLADDLPAVVGDATQFRQVIMNLLTNAAEAFGQEGGSVFVRTRRRHPTEVERAATAVNATGLTEGLYVEIEVEDDGPGMDEDTQERMFDPFFTTKGTGSGLGLASVLGIVRAHHGAVVVDSRRGVGTSVRVLLPASMEALRHQASDAPTRVEQSQGRILVIDDDDAVRTMVCEVLSSAGFEATPAQSGERAIEVFRSTPLGFDAVLLDMTMPGMDGEATFRALRDMGVRAPVVLTTGYTEAGVPEAIESGLAGLLVKPYAASKLIEVFHDLLSSAPS